MRDWSMNVPSLSRPTRTQPKEMAGFWPVNLTCPLLPCCVRPLALAVVLLPAVLVLSGCQPLMIPDPAVRYIAFGDSTTAGPADRQYWEFVRDDLGLPSDSFAGQGHGGETSTEGLVRLRTLLDSGIYPNAEVLLYWEGANDILDFVQNQDPLLLFPPDSSIYPFKDELAAALDTVEANIDQAVQMGHQAGLTVYVATYYSFSADAEECKPALLGVLLPGQLHLVNDYVELLNARIRKAAGNAGAVLVDVSTRTAQLAADPANYANCNHLTSRGTKIVAEVFEAAMH